MGKTRNRPFMTAILLAVSFLGTVFVLSPLSRALAASHSSVTGNVYVLNNPAGTNSISVFDRAPQWDADLCRDDADWWAGEREQSWLTRLTDSFSAGPFALRRGCRQ